MPKVQRFAQRSQFSCDADALEREVLRDFPSLGIESQIVNAPGLVPGVQRRLRYSPRSIPVAQKPLNPRHKARGVVCAHCASFSLGMSLPHETSLAEAIQMPVRPQVDAVIDDRRSRERLLTEIGRVQRAAFFVRAEHRQSAFLVDHENLAVSGDR